MVKRKDGLWQEQVTVTVAGRKTQKYFYGKTKAIVLRKIADYQEAQTLGPTFEAVADAWWEEAEPALAVNTRGPYKAALTRAKDRFKDRRFRELRPADIADFLHDFIEQTKAADKTARTQLMVVNLISKYAVRKGMIDINPARDLSVPRGLSHQKRSAPLSDDIKRVKESTGCTFGLFAYWLLYTGCRRGELLALTWEDVDLKENVIRISNSIYDQNGKACIKPPKTEAGIREVPILNRLREKMVPGKGIIFPNKNGGYMTEAQCRSAWTKYCAESGVTCTPHQLRHAYATMLYEANVEAKDAQYLLGHAQLSTTMDIYTDIRAARAAKVRAALNDVDIV